MIFPEVVQLSVQSDKRRDGEFDDATLAALAQQLLDVMVERDEVIADDLPAPSGVQVRYINRVRVVWQYVISDGRDDGDYWIARADALIRPKDDA